MTILVSQTELITQVKAGKVVSFPTDTVPALATLPENAEAIFKLKARSPDKPLILMGAAAVDLWPYVSGNAKEWALWQQIAERYWPGALTLVLPASDLVPQAMNALDPTTIGIRVADCLTAYQILSQTGPLATTSANRSGEPPQRSMAAIAAAFPQVWTLEEREGDNRDIGGSGLPSTVAKWTKAGWEILRQGSVKIMSDQ